MVRRHRSKRIVSRPLQRHWHCSRIWHRAAVQWARKMRRRRLWKVCCHSRAMRSRTCSRRRSMLSYEFPMLMSMPAIRCCRRCLRHLSGFWEMMSQALTASPSLSSQSFWPRRETTKITIATPTGYARLARQRSRRSCATRRLSGRRMLLRYTGLRQCSRSTRKWERGCCDRNRSSGRWLKWSRWKMMTFKSRSLKSTRTPRTMRSISDKQPVMSQSSTSRQCSNRSSRRCARVHA
mmetsp:Transcript_59217/g.98041  ORF Transcript_59217/g.98041 Transcript_59217/m.98041 type:complete len:236 (+) Transcript_59217:371-1078(+)